MILVCGPGDDHSHRAAEALGIDAATMLAHRPDATHLVIEASEGGIDIIATDGPGAAELVLLMLTNGCPAESILLPPPEVLQAVIQGRH